MKRALVLCGGGSKGAYEMGAWKALRELKESFDIVTGTSIGSLNGAMYVQGDYDECLELWNTTRNSSILAKPFKFEDDNLKMSLKKIDDLVPFVRSYLLQKGMDITPFKEMMSKYLNPEKIRSSKMEFGVVVVQFPSFKPKYINIKEVEDELIAQYVLASSSCFPLFPVCKIGNKNYIDGGYYDNLPINYALELGAKEIVAIDLNHQITHKDFLNKPFVKYIYPSWSLGGFFVFEEDIIKRNMTLGYNDTMKAYRKLDGYRYSFYKNDKSLNDDFIIEVANVNRLFVESKTRSLAKTPEGSNLYKILEKHTISPLNAYEYYIRGIEVALEFFDVDYLKIYHIDEAKEIILKEINGIDLTNMNLANDYNQLKNRTKKRDYLVKIPEKHVLAFAAEYVLKNRFTWEDMFLDIMSIYPNVILILALIKVWVDEDAYNEEKFGFDLEFEA